ncbi:MAG: ABC transporter permease, partial [Bacteroidia bacterium]|nr:ABC transporter permease [Bacteroidia bacterium]
MNKIWIVIVREYLTRVKNKAFIISTLLAPLGFALLTLLPILVAKFNEKESYSVLVKDPSHLVSKSLNSDSQFQFSETQAPVDSIKEWIKQNPKLILLEIPTELDKQSVNVNLYSQKSLNIQTEGHLHTILKDIFRDYKLIQAGIDRQKLKETEIELSLTTVKIGDTTEEKTNSAQATIIGYGMSLLMYMLVMIYGSLVMRGVMEEKSNRIVEVIISSIKPIEFMLGKIIGIAAVGLTQFLLWCIQIFGLLFLIGLLLGVTGLGGEIPVEQQKATPEQMKMAQNIAEGLANFKFSLLFYFAIYFLGGYLIYSCLFAAVGSAIEQES